MSFSMAKRSNHIDDYKKTVDENRQLMYKLNNLSYHHSKKDAMIESLKHPRDIDHVAMGTNRLIRSAFGVEDLATCGCCETFIDSGPTCAPCEDEGGKYEKYSHNEPEAFAEALTHRNDPTIGRAGFKLPMPGDIKPEVKAKPIFEDEVTGTLFEQATKRHDKLAKAWGELIVDPLNALTHSSLFDVAVPKTAAFIEAYGEVQDLASIFANRAVTDAEAERYYRAVKRAEVLWEAALDYADRRNYNWLPEDERKLAHQADHLLRMANDEGQTDQARMNYAKRAVALMEKIYTIKLPTEMKLALEAKTTLAITAPTN